MLVEYLLIMNNLFKSQFIQCINKRDLFLFSTDIFELPKIERNLLKIKYCILYISIFNYFFSTNYERSMYHPCFIRG